MSRLKKLEFEISNLSDDGRKMLRAGGCLNEDEYHLWLSKAQWFDTTHDNR